MQLAKSRVSKKKIYALGAIVLALSVLLAPVYASAAIVPCGGSGQPSCSFDYLIVLIKNIVTFLLFSLAVPLAAISFAVAGVMILTAGDNSGQVSRAKEIFWNVLIGLIVALSAWLIVTAITSALQSSSVPSYLK
ncbi:MAG: hypothetical protein Q7S11_02875 [bacterium]|nr:hypothetical protein [bacterium]